LKVGIESNGLYWYSDKSKGKNYHLNKYMEAKSMELSEIEEYEEIGE